MAAVAGLVGWIVAVDLPGELVVVATLGVHTKALLVEGHREPAPGAALDFAESAPEAAENQTVLDL
jgi:hypothetical protein